MPIDLPAIGFLSVLVFVFYYDQLYPHNIPLSKSVHCHICVLKQHDDRKSSDCFFKESRGLCQTIFGRYFNEHMNVIRAHFCFCYLHSFFVRITSAIVAFYLSLSLHISPLFCILVLVLMSLPFTVRASSLYYLPDCRPHSSYNKAIFIVHS